MIDLSPWASVGVGFGGHDILGSSTLPAYAHDMLAALVWLDLSFNSFSELTAIIAFVQSCPRLRHLFLHGNPLCANRYWKPYSRCSEMRVSIRALTWSTDYGALWRRFTLLSSVRLCFVTPFLNSTCSAAFCLTTWLLMNCGCSQAICYHDVRSNIVAGNGGFGHATQYQEWI